MKMFFGSTHMSIQLTVAAIFALAGNLSQAHAFSADDAHPTLRNVTATSLIEDTIQENKNFRKSHGGGDTGGGSFVVLPSGEKVLLDLYLKDPTLSFMKFSRAGESWPETKAYDLLGLDRIAVTDPLVQKVRALAKKWSGNAPRLARILEKAVVATPFYYMKYDLNVQDRNFVLPSGADKLVSRSSLKTGAIYVEGLGVLTSKSDFDRLNEVNQVATLTHEGFRHAQLGYGYRLSNQALQEITATMVLGNPEREDSLDRHLQALVSDPLQTIQHAKNLICQVVRKYPVADVSCAQVQRLTEVRSIIGSLRKTRDGLLPYIGSGNDNVARGALRSDRDLASTMLNIGTVQSTSGLVGEAHAGSDNLNDLIVEERNSALTAALKNPADPVTRQKLQEIFNDLLATGVLK